MIRKQEIILSIKRVRGLTLAFALLMLALPSFASKVPTEPQLILEPGFHTAMLRAVAVSGDGKRIVSVSDDKSARVFDDQGRLLRVIRVPQTEGHEGKLYAVALSPDAKTIALSGWTGWDFDGSCSIYLYETETGTMLRRIKGLPNAVFDLAFSPSTAAGPILLACAMGPSAGLLVFNSKSGEQVFADPDYSDRSNAIAFSPDGNLMAASCMDGTLNLYGRFDGTIKLIASTKHRPGQQSYGLSFSPKKVDGAYLIAIGYDVVCEVDVFLAQARSLEYSYSADTSGMQGGGLIALTFGATSNKSNAQPVLVAGGSFSDNGQYPLVVWEDAGRGKRSFKHQQIFSTIMDIKAINNADIIVATADPILARYDKLFATRFSFLPQVADFRDNHAGFRISTDGRLSNFAFEPFGKSPATFSLDDRNLVEPRDLPPQDTSSLDIINWNYHNEPRLGSKRLSLENYEKSMSLAISPDKNSFLLGTHMYLRCFDKNGNQLWQAAAPSASWAVAVSADGSIGSASYGDGTIRYYKMSDGKLLLNIYPHPDRKRWVAWTASGYYDASIGADDFLRWHLNNGLDQAPDSFPLSRWKSTYYRPDVIGLVLSKKDEKLALEEANRTRQGSVQVANDIRTNLPPLITILSPSTGTSFSGKSVTISYRVRTPSGGTISGMRVLIDGRPLETTRGLGKILAADREQSIEIELPGRDVSVSLIAESGALISEPASVALKYQGSVSQDAFKPKLYVLAIGVSKYQKSELNLALAAKDAQDTVDALLKQKGQLYRDVEVQILKDTDANKDNILDGLDWIRTQTTARDVAMIFLAGHGINDNSGSYYFLPSNADPERLLRTGLAFSDIQNVVRSIAGKALFFIDSCHSGNVMGQGRRAVAVDVDAMVNDLASAENGAVVFTASTGRQFSLESPEWGNGAFTKALVEGLGGKADVNDDGAISVKELDLYIAERVKKLTGGKQSPTTVLPVNVPDFPVAARVTQLVY